MRPRTEGDVWWNGERGLAFGLEMTGRRWRRLVMCFYVFVITIRVEHHLIPEDFVISGEITAVTLAVGERACGQIEVKTRSDAASCSNTSSCRKGRRWPELTRW